MQKIMRVLKLAGHSLTAVNGFSIAKIMRVLKPQKYYNIHLRQV